ncbi:aminotransferase class I/II-fold pyridoxal phosphate-dependent enzyme [Flavobacterium silvisoli]|uniref:Aminotransferase class I/II-fold pyridoxal phosphate-dependent enzyme n=1 Tax=Flavobacterium silvisoli TaxID=2529433 RepID=A0A4Q9YR50_9FLAO|nr:methionine aminotransferase [Flavobacterium silvisoli]TBX64967.1 aminotransferase class I/II-fold pyridoxal phosphate-dependent enzyme [Flavobacterium silvisoli]
MSKLAHVGTSIFTVMSQLANEYGAINLSQGFPNFTVDERLTEILSKQAKENVHQYAPMAGFSPLLEKIAILTRQSYNRIVDPKAEVLVTAGATEGIFAAVQALVAAGKEVVILDPSYDCYETPILLCNAKPVHVSLHDDFTPNWEAINAAVNHNTRMLIINNPHNPTGKTWTAADFDRLEALAEANPHLIILSDEVYEYITFEKAHLSIHQRPKFWERSISVSSFGKSFHITGWKIGYVIAPEPLMREIKKVHQFLVFSVNSVAQATLSEYLDVVDLSALGKFYQQKRDFFRALMKNCPLELLPCEGTYFQVASYAGISEESDLDFSKRLLIDYGVATIPISAFYPDGKDLKLIRFCFAKDDSTLIEATKRLEKLR